MTRVYVYPADFGGCGYYRLLWPAAAIDDPDVEVVYPAGPASVNVLSTYHDQDGRVRGVDYPPDADVVVVQRPMKRVVPTAIRELRARGIAVVVDVDDALDMIDGRHPVFAGMHPRRGGDATWSVVREACAAATIVTVSTPALKAMYAPDNGVVLPNYVPRVWLDQPRVDSPVVSWCGSLGSHPGDLAVVGSAVAQLVRSGVTYRTVGSGEGVAAAFGLDDRDDMPVGSVPLAGWPSAVASAGIAIAPLAATRFNTAKSWLKPLEAMAAGVPVVMSPRAEYSRLHADTGVGFLADRPRQWAGLLRRLVDDAGLRAEQSTAGREAVAGRYVLEDHAWRWAEVWAGAAVRERSLVGAA